MWADEAALDAAARRLDEWESSLAARAARARDLSARTQALTGTARSADGLIEVTVDANGLLADLRLDERVRHSESSDMGMMVTARRIEAPADEVRYEFGFEDRFDRILVIDPQTLQARVEDGDFNAAASAITAKIVNARRDRGDFPQRMLFAS
ncbi:YbaB/EbfC family nucleoid-associated protein [Micromonospora sp. AMSO1212t]|uniref:YbaB/EbfC family nucleoid-associated protein n=1 Tax=Micromonospora sp. AMSO1212t TaxID=2650565 RepID=UPI001CEDBDE8|nr:YbaB/EbfC family nucleoid-associated protein [Micromonospora sp. AMSO1212t]